MGGIFPKIFFQKFFVYTLFKGLSPLLQPKTPPKGGGIRRGGRGIYPIWGVYSFILYPSLPSIWLFREKQSFI